VIGDLDELRPAFVAPPADAPTSEEGAVAAVAVHVAAALLSTIAEESGTGRKRGGAAARGTGKAARLARPIESR
jgi:hypothetical protein